MEPVVEILYFEGCPNHPGAAELVERIAAETGVAPAVRLVEVETVEEVKRLRFLGSPTIRVDGCDIEPGADERDTFVLACRVYKTDAGYAGQPDERWVREAFTRPRGT